MHARIDHGWSIEQLAKIAALSRSAFFERFTRLVGVAPMEYLLAWRMEIAKALLRDDELAVSEIAERVGYWFDQRLQRGVQQACRAATAARTRRQK